MKKYNVSYTGNSRMFQNFSAEVFANSEREAVEDVFQTVNDSDYFPQNDGSIQDADGEVIASISSTTIDYDGGCFSAAIISTDPNYLIYDTTSDSPYIGEGGQNCDLEENAMVFKTKEEALREINTQGWLEWAKVKETSFPVNSCIKL